MGKVNESESKGPIYFMAPYRIIVDAVGGGSLWFTFNNKEAALHFAVAADAARAGEILNEHFYEVLESALATEDATERAECDAYRAACRNSPEGYGSVDCSEENGRCDICVGHDARRAAGALPPSGERE